MYSQIYNNIVVKGQILKESYKKESGLHKHHIIPKHMGGDDGEDNLTYLTVREHIICHYLLWKMHGNVNDLRSMKMLGANLTPYQRKITGEFCRDNNIGFHNCSKENRSEWSRRGLLTQKKLYEQYGTKNYYYWSCTKEGRRELGRLGGLKRASKEFNYWASEEGRKKRASLGGKSLKGRKVMTNPNTNKWHRIKPEDVEEKLKMGWYFGTSPSS